MAFWEKMVKYHEILNIVLTPSCDYLGILSKEDF